MAAWDKDLDTAQPAMAASGVSPAWEKDLDPVAPQPQQQTAGTGVDPHADLRKSLRKDLAAAEVGRSKLKRAEINKDLAAGLVRGAGSIGATIMWPIDKVTDMVQGDREQTLSGLVTGEKPLSRNEERRRDMTATLKDWGAKPDSTSFAVGKLGGEIAGTAGAGGALANTAARIPGVAVAAPGFINALRTGGMTTGQAVAPGAMNALGNLGVRAAGGAITGGASAGLVDPEQAGMGAVVGGALPIVTRVAGIAGRATGGAVRGVIEPFTERGRQAIVGRTMQRFGIDPADVAGLTDAPTITGARQGLAEQIQRPAGAAGAARLQDAVRSLDPSFSSAMAAREVENNAARVNTLRNLAGRDGARDFAAANRAGTSGPMYQEAFKVDPGAIDIPERELRVLMRMPAIREAAAAARVNASNAGKNVGASNASGSIEGLHQTKLALDDAITKASSKTTPAGDNTVRGLRDAQRRLVAFIESVSPEYANARGVHAQMSRPINQMDVAGQLLERGASNTSDLAGYPRLMPNALMGQMSDEAALIRGATGRNLGGSLNAMMEPQQLAQMRAVASEVDRAAAVGRAGAGPGSPTAQRLASGNLLTQMGAPQAAADNALVQTLMRPVQFAAQVAEPRIQQTLLDVIQNPAAAQRAMQAATPAQRVKLQALMREAERLGYRVAPVAATSR